jgi:protein TonB
MPDGIVDPLLVPPVAPPRPVGPVDEQTAGLTLPQPLSRPAPEYPPIAIRAGRSGRVVLRAVIGTDGAVGPIQVVQAPRPDLGLVAAALAAVSCWTYEPGRLDGRPVAVSMTVIVDFAIE